MGYTQMDDSMDGVEVQLVITRSSRINASTPSVMTQLPRATMLPGREYRFDLFAYDGMLYTTYRATAAMMETPRLGDVDINGNDIHDELEAAVDAADGIAAYCGSKFGDDDGDSVPSNVEVQIGLECRDGAPGAEIALVGNEPLRIEFDLAPGLSVVDEWVIYPGAGPLTRIRGFGGKCMGGTGECTLALYSESISGQDSSCFDDRFGAAAVDCVRVDIDDDGTFELGSFARELLWVARDELGNWASTLSRVYVQPSVGFVASAVPVDADGYAHVPVSVSVSGDVISSDPVLDPVLEFSVGVIVSAGTETEGVSASLGQSTLTHTVVFPVGERKAQDLTLEIVEAFVPGGHAEFLYGITQLFTLGNHQVQVGERAAGVGVEA